VSLSCSAFNQCSWHGTCAYNSVTNAVYCECAVGWSGASCSIQVYATSTLSATEIGGSLITITSIFNFTMWDNVTCIFGGASVTGFIVPPLAYCTVPPYYTYLVFQPFTLLVNGTSKITSRLLYSYSNMLPTSSTQLSSFLWTTGTARTINYNTTNVFSLGNSTVAVHLYQWNFDPFDINVPTPVLVDLGVITSGPNNDTISVTIPQPFAWTTALYVLSLQSGYYTYNQYVALNSSTAAAQCTDFGENVIDVRNSGGFAQSCPSDPNSPIEFAACSLVVSEPPIEKPQTCLADPDTEDICLYPSMTPNTWYQLWEPFKFSLSEGPVVQYFASTQLPKVFCC